MTYNEQFEGKPWNTESTEAFNQPDYWRAYYEELLSDVEHSYRKEHAVTRDCHCLMQLFELTKTLPLSTNSTSYRFLDAGCGISVIPDILAFWGFQVTAIDSCADAISICKVRKPTDIELAKSIWIWGPSADMNDSLTIVDDPNQSLQKLYQYKSSGGSVQYLTADWNDKHALCGPFDYIYCRNSLRRSIKPYWRTSLNRFLELLAPGGILILDTLNAIGILFEVRELLDEIGYNKICAHVDRSLKNKYVFDFWQTG